jgi:hypothetical protein
LPLTPIARPLPFFAYPFLVLTFLGWIVAIVRQREDYGVQALGRSKAGTAAAVR